MYTPWSPPVIGVYGLCSAPPRGTCTDIPVNQRRDCGYSGILPDECLQRRCCFDSSASPFCYLNKFVEIPSGKDDTDLWFGMMEYDSSSSSSSSPSSSSSSSCPLTSVPDPRAPVRPGLPAPLPPPPPPPPPAPLLLFLILVLLLDLVFLLLFHLHLLLLLLPSYFCS